MNRVNDSCAVSLLTVPTYLSLASNTRILTHTCDKLRKRHSGGPRGVTGALRPSLPVVPLYRHRWPQARLRRVSNLRVSCAGLSVSDIQLHDPELMRH